MATTSRWPSPLRSVTAVDDGRSVREGWAPGAANVPSPLPANVNTPNVVLGLPQPGTTRSSGPPSRSATSRASPARVAVDAAERTGASNVPSALPGSTSTTRVLASLSFTIVTRSTWPAPVTAPSVKLTKLGAMLPSGVATGAANVRPGVGSYRYTSTTCAPDDSCSSATRSAWPSPLTSAVLLISM